MKRVAIFGDVCVDAYWVGRPASISVEAPVPVIKQTRWLTLPGMAGNVAALLEGLGDIDLQLCYPEGGNRPIKNRLITEAGEQLARWDIEDWCTPIGEDEFKGLGELDAAIVCDYAKGAISPLAKSRLRSLADGGLPLYIDTKGDPFDWLGLPEATLFPNAKEYAQWQSHYDWMPSVVAKAGSEGMTLRAHGNELFRENARAWSVQNVCGAGDSVIAAYTWARIHNYPEESALSFASDAAAWVVSHAFDERSLTGACFLQHYTTT